ncbi:oleate hydratase [Mucilaginibacter sp. HC2]|uniref:oleate hydratase n=1 Tax=Mucilaginibacter inviolabilis TaxID=2714892 RepID=UPI00140B23D1|nr:oleate hydratase [Mucilaginibacter inviolabilis]NHA03381.1 oleate hydratase [Mucilaginibacter inviolabilis]
MKNTNDIGKHPHVYLVGGGIASLAAAAYFIRDGEIPADQITIFEEMNIAGGSLDGGGTAENGYVLRGGRMLNFSYHCTYDLFSFIPSLTDPDVTVLEEIKAFNKKIKTHAGARVVEGGSIIDVSSMGFSNKDRLDLMEMMAVTESYLETRRIDEWFEPAFFKTNFWFMWDTMFAFQPWHSAVEFKRYLHRFLHEFSRINTLAGVDRTPYNQFDSMAKPLIRWLKKRGVRFEMGVQVTGLDFCEEAGKKVVERIHYVQNQQELEISIISRDLVLVTIGSMTADSSLGTMESPPELITGKKDGSWRLWEQIAQHSSEFGRPFVFDNRVEESKWESFTVTCQGTQFFDLMEEFSGNPAGTGALVTFKDSNWLMSIVLAYQPHFIGQPEGVTVFWGYGLFPDRVGNFIPKKMADCSGAEIMSELLSHLRFDQAREQIINSCNCIPCMLPYITSEFLTRAAGDRPEVVPADSVNLAFIGQFAEMPDDTVFTVEYSVRTAQTAVYQLLKLDKEPAPMYHGARHPEVLFDAMKTMLI